jgi:hypothetical protein
MGIFLGIVVVLVAGYFLYKYFTQPKVVYPPSAGGSDVKDGGSTPKQKD